MQHASSHPASISHLVVDVETANRHRRSICQIAVITVMTDGTKERFGVYVDPREPFELTHIHGITARQVADSPTFKEVYAQIADKVRGRIVVTHSAFDPQAFRAACMHHGLPGMECRWVDSVDLAQAAWPHFPNHKLKTLSQKLRIPLNHHDAVSDAYATAVMVDQALARTGTTIAAWTPSPRKGEGPPLARPGAPGQPFTGQRVVFTGSFLLDTETLAVEAAAAGYEVQNAVTKKTDVLVQGAQHVDLAARHPKSAKTLKAESLRAEGQAIEILTEAMFRSRVVDAMGRNVLSDGLGTVKAAGGTTDLGEVMDLDAYVAARTAAPEGRGTERIPPSPALREMHAAVQDGTSDADQRTRAARAPAPLQVYEPTTIWQDFFRYQGVLPRGVWGKKFLLSWVFAVLALLAGIVLSQLLLVDEGQRALLMVGPLAIVLFGYMMPLCARRSRDIGVPTWLGALVFFGIHLVPFAPLLYYAALLAIPGRAPRPTGHPVAATSPA